MTTGLILGLLAETYVHPGSGQEEGESAVDLPVARERPTWYPFVPGSGVKGAFRDAARLRALEEKQGDEAAAEKAITPTFGDTDEAGRLVFSDAKLLLLPVRSLEHPYVWLTCPHLLQRLARDCERLLGVSLKLPKLDPAGKVIMGAGTGTGRLFLEELSFEITARKADIDVLAAVLKPLLAEDGAKERLAGQLTVVSDADLTWFARQGLPVQARNKLNAHKVSENLFYEETLPPDTLLYTLVSERRAGEIGHVTGLLDRRPWIQLGGNETLGQGWLKVARPGASDFPQDQGRTA